MIIEYYFNFELQSFSNIFNFNFSLEDNAAKSKMDSALKRLCDLHICSKIEKEKRFREKEKSTE